LVIIPVGSTSRDTVLGSLLLEVVSEAVVDTEYLSLRVTLGLDWQLDQVIVAWDGSWLNQPRGYTCIKTCSTGIS